MAIRSDSDVNQLLGRPEWAEVDEGALIVACRMAKARGIPWRYAEAPTDDDLPEYVQRALAADRALGAARQAGISDEDLRRAQEEALHADRERVLRIVYRGAILGAAQAAQRRASDLYTELLGIAQTAEGGAGTRAGAKLADQARAPHKPRMLQACLALGEEATDRDVERAKGALTGPTRPVRPPARRNSALPPGFDAFDVDDGDDYAARLTDTLRRGDVLRIGRTRWVVVRDPRGNVEVELYKFPSRQQKMYRALISGGEVEIFEINGVGDRIAKVLDASEADVQVERGAGRDQLGY
jgi:hypothetical protein